MMTSNNIFFSSEQARLRCLKDQIHSSLATARLRLCGRETLERVEVKSIHFLRKMQSDICIGVR